MQSRFEQLQQRLQNHRDSDEAIFSWAEGKPENLYYEIKDNHDRRIAEKFMALAGDIIGAWISSVPEKGHKPDTIAQEMKATQEIHALLLAAAAKVCELTVSGKTGLAMHVVFPQGFPREFSASDCDAIDAVDVLSPIENLAIAAGAALKDYDQSSQVSNTDLHREKVGAMRVYIARDLAIAWEECTGRQPACTPDGIFDKVLQVAFDAAGLPLAKSTKDIILATRPTNKNGNEPPENR